MVFGFFSRKPIPEDSTNADTNPSASLTGSVPPQSPSPPPEDIAAEAHVGPTDVPSLYKLVKSIPPKVLYDYTVTRLRSDDDIEPGPILSFYSELKPPTKWHCVRCHQDYFEVDNTDRSCQIDHDDDSAEVERVGGRDIEYETLYGCCDRTVEGEGDMGPPDGWCYEGEHTTDPVRARFRADSTPRNPRLTPCTRHCRPSSGMGVGVRKRRRAQSESEATENEGDEDSGMEEMTGKKTKAKPVSPKKRAPKKSKMVQDEQETQQSPTPQTPNMVASTDISSPPKQRKRTRKSAAMVEETQEGMEVSPPEKPKAKSRSKKKADEMDVDAESSPKPKATRTPTKRAARATKAKADDEHAANTDTSGPSPKPSVRSAMKARPAAKPRSTAKRAKALKEVVATSIEGEDV